MPDEHPEKPIKRTQPTGLSKRRLGKTELEVTVMGLGGEGLLRTVSQEKAAARLINKAIDLGINYFESARAYSDSEKYYGEALKERRKDIILNSKSHARDKAGALAHLHETLASMKTDYLDLWQVHDVRTEADMAAIFGPGGAIEAFVEAREKGLVRFIGVTGHQDPVIIRKCLETFDFDTVLIPVNPAEPAYRCFVEEVVPAASARDVGIVGMKVFLRGRLDAPKRLMLSYALTQPIATAVVGCDSIAQLEENVEAAATFQMLKSVEVQRFTEFVAPYAKDLMYYKP